MNKKQIIWPLLSALLVACLGYADDAGVGEREWSDEASVLSTLSEFDAQARRAWKEYEAIPIILLPLHPESHTEALEISKRVVENKAVRHTAYDHAVQVEATFIEMFCRALVFFLEEGKTFGEIRGVLDEFIVWEEAPRKGEYFAEQRGYELKDLNSLSDKSGWNLSVEWYKYELGDKEIYVLVVFGLGPPLESEKAGFYQHIALRISKEVVCADPVPAEDKYVYVGSKILEDSKWPATSVRLKVE